MIYDLIGKVRGTGYIVRMITGMNSVTVVFLLSGEIT